MGLYNILNAVTPCPSCGQSDERRIQFKYGNSRLNELEIGSKIDWEVNVRGKPWPGISLTSGITDACNRCGADPLYFVIELRGDDLVAVWPRTADDDPYWDDLDANYVIHFDLATPVEEKSGRRASLRDGKWTTDDYED